MITINGGKTQPHEVASRLAFSQHADHLRPTQRCVGANARSWQDWGAREQRMHH
jgi:hypothetical protein